jgi:outer membrane protein assembly factor BamD
MRRSRLVLCLVVICAACAGKKPLVPAGDLWKQGNEAMNDEAYDLAVERYKKLLDSYPFDPNAEQAELKIAQAHFNLQHYPEAIAKLDDFERMHPTSDNLPEIEYRRGMAHLAQHRSSDRDQQAVRNALETFWNIVERYPGTPWASRAELRVRECREELASHDADIAAFYLGRGSLRAAESRLRGLLTDYPETEATARSLDSFAKMYAARDEPEEANLALATLVKYHPNNPLGIDAAQKLGSLDPSQGQDPLPMLVSRIDEMRTQADREKVPKTVSAYTDRPGMPGGARY